MDRFHRRLNIFFCIFLALVAFALAACGKKKMQAGFEEGRSIFLLYGPRKPFFDVKELLLPAAEKGHAEAMCYYGIACGARSGEAAKWFRKAADKGNGFGMVLLGECYERGLVEIADPAEGDTLKREGIKVLRHAANQDDVDALIDLALCYRLGIGVEQDAKKAFELLCKAAEKGSTCAMIGIGACYMEGEGVEQDAKKGFKWFHKAADKGNVLAMDAIGFCYMEGEGVEQDAKEGLKWYRKAAGKGNTGAMTAIGLCYMEGKDVKKDNKEAVKWFRKAAADESSSFLRSRFLEKIAEDTSDPEAAKLAKEALEELK